jgi:AraC-like DNA-binding protein
MIDDPSGLELTRLVERAYRPFDQPTDLVHAFVRALVDHAPVQRAEVRLNANGARPSAPPGTSGTSEDPDRLPLAYRGRLFGELRVERKGSGAAAAWLGEAAGVLTRLLQRYEVRHYTRAHLDSDLWLVGVAPCVRLLEVRIERMASLAMPLLIQGEFGCEKRAVAAAVHAASRPDQPFIEIRCSGAADAALFRATLDQVGERLQGGTLFLSDVDDLEATCQKTLLELLTGRRTAGWWLEPGRLAPGPQPRLMASSSTSLRRLADAGAFSKELWSILDFLRLHVAPLRDRRGDIRHHIEYVSTRYAGGESIAFSPDAMGMLVDYDWPGNLTELARTIGRLAAIKAGTVIDAADLHEWASELLPEGRAELPATSSNGSQASHATADDLFEAASPISPPDPVLLARELLEGRLSPLDGLHPGMQRALTYLATHFQEEVSLDQLAQESFVSGSYLCALFRRTFGLGFKRFQSILRVERAKDLLLRDRYQRITDVSLEVGFGDFSYFLKTFKRHTHISPREFRKRHTLTP